MALTKKTGNEKPRPQIGKTSDKTRLVRFVDLNKTIEEVEAELLIKEQEILDLQNQIDNLPTSPPAPTTTTVNISSAQILAMGTTPIALLPAAGANMYYDIEKVVLEFTAGTTPYTSDHVFGFRRPVNYYLEAGSLSSSSNWQVVAKSSTPVLDITNGVSVVYVDTENSSFLLEKWSGTGSPTLGDGTLRAIITYTVRTFGA